MAWSGFSVDTGHLDRRMPHLWPTRPTTATHTQRLDLTKYYQCPASDVRCVYRRIQVYVGKALVRASYRVYSAGPATPLTCGSAVETCGELPARDT